MKRLFNRYLAMSMLLVHGALFAVCMPDPGTRIWNIVAEDLVIDCQTLSKVCALGSFVENIDFNCSGIDQVLSKVCIIGSTVDIIEELDQTILSKVCVIDSKIDALAPCGLIPIFDNNPTISVSGSYCLAQNITGTLIITVDDVVIDMNNHMINGGLNGISIDANLSNITIRNGTIQRTTEEGILVGQGCSKIYLQDLVLSECVATSTSAAIVLSGTLANQVTECIVSNVNIVDCHSGIFGLFSSRIQIKDCSIISCNGEDITAGIAFIGDVKSLCTDLLVQNCFISTITGSTGTGLLSTGVGILGFATRNLIIDSCIIEHCIGNAQGCAGIGLLDSENIKISHCSICDIESINNTSASGIIALRNTALVIDNCTIQGITGARAGGIDTNSCIELYVRNCVAQAIFANPQSLNSDAAAGFRVRTGFGFPTAENITFENCSAQHIQGNDLSGANGFLCEGAFNGLFINECSALNLVSTGDMTNSYGFLILDGESATLNNTTVQDLTGANIEGYHFERTNNIVVNECISTNIANTASSGFVRGFFFNNVSVGNVSNCLSTGNQNPFPFIAHGFSTTACSDLIFDFCTTSSNYSSDSNSAHGFIAENSSGIFFESCTSSYNAGDAFRITADNSLVGNCTAAYSGIGFDDLSLTSTFYDNVAAKNSTANYSGGIPFVVAQGSATITGGNASI